MPSSIPEAARPKAAWKEAVWDSRPHAMGAISAPTLMPL